MAHLAEVKGDFDNDNLDEECVLNMDESNFHVNLDHGSTLNFRGVEHVKYLDVVSGGMSHTFVVQVSRGRHGDMGPGFVVFQNPSSRYPILCVEDSVLGVSCRTGPKG